MKRLFGLIEKIEEADDGTIRVFGVASSEDVDDQGETVLASAMRDALPDYMRYPALREMHQLSAAGTTLEAEVDDAGKTHIVARVVDQGAISKVKNQVYRGFSIGGKVTGREAGNPKTITALSLSEISLVDRPANPSASLDLWKVTVMPETEAAAGAAPFNPPMQIWACGVEGHRHIAKSDAIKCLEKMASGIRTISIRDGGDPELATSDTEREMADLAAKALREDEEQQPEPLDPAEIEKRAADGAAAEQAAITAAMRAIERGEAVAADDRPAESLAPEVDRQIVDHVDQAPLAKGGDAPGEGDKPYGDVEYADPGYQSDGKKRYPLSTEKKIRSAWSYINVPENCAKYSGGDCAKVKAKIIAAWKSKIDKDGPPSAADKAAWAEFQKTVITKSIYDVGEIAMLIVQLDQLSDRLAYEAAVEGDASSTPAKAAAICAQLCDLLRDVVAEETAEILEGDEIEEPLGMEMGPVAMTAIADSLRKTIADPQIVEQLVNKLNKAGARLNAMDQMHLDAAARNVGAAMGMDGVGKGDMVHLGEVHKALLDSGATAHGPTPEHLTDSNPTRGSPTENSTVDTGHNARTSVPKASDLSLMFDALGKSAALEGGDAIVAEADRLYKEGAKPFQVLANVAHGHLGAACDGATCKDAASKPTRLSAETMAHMDKAHFHLTKCTGAMKCDAAGNMIPGGAPGPSGEEEEQGTKNTAAAGSEDLAKSQILFAQMMVKMADRLEVETTEVGNMRKTIAAYESRLKAVEDQPLPPKTIAKGTVSVSKSEDNADPAAVNDPHINEEIAKAWAAMSKDEQTIALIKGTRMRPNEGRLNIPGFTDGPKPASPIPQK